MGDILWSIRMRGTELSFILTGDFLVAFTMGRLAGKSDSLRFVAFGRRSGVESGVIPCTRE
jgi:hypothetical protein